MTSRGQARHGKITLHCSLQSQPSDPVQCPSIKAPPPIAHSQHRNAGGSKSSAGLRNFQSSAERPSPLCSLQAGEGQGSSAVPPPAPNPRWVHGESLWRQALWWGMHRSLIHPRISLCFKSIKSKEQLYSAAKDPLEFKYLCRAWLFQQEQQQPRRGSFRIPFWLILSVFIANGILWGVKEFLE